MKRIITQIAAVLLVLQLFIFSTDAMSLSDSITSDVSSITSPLDEKEYTRDADRVAAQAMLNYVAKSSASCSLNSYLTVKNLTKGELEAFKWSFILSQFAIPLTDNLLSIFNNDIFSELYADGRAVNSIQELRDLNASLGNTNIFSETSNMEASSLSGFTMLELKEIIEQNLAYYPVFTSSDSTDAHSLTFRELVQGTEFPGGMVFYFFDAIDTQVFYNSAMNSYFLDRESLFEAIVEGKDTSVSLTTRAYPAFVYNSSTILYLQTAIGIYCKLNNLVLADLVNTFGNCSIFIDSYANICMYDGRNYSIVIPNFGNPIVSNSYVDVDNKQTEERFNLYNRWIMNCYSRSVRTDNQVFPAVDDTTLLCSYVAGTSLASMDTEVTKWYANGTAQYVDAYLVDSDVNSDVSGNILFFEPNDLHVNYATDGDFFSWFRYRDLSESAVIKSVLPGSSVATEVIGTVAELLANDTAYIDSNGKLSASTAGGSVIGDLYPAINLLKGVSIPTSTDSKVSFTGSNVYLGEKLIGYMGFAGISTINNPGINSAAVKAYINPYPYIQSNVRLNQGINGFKTILSALQTIFLQTSSYDFSILLKDHLDDSKLNTAHTYIAPYSVINSCYAVALGWNLNLMPSIPTYNALNSTSSSSNAYLFLKDCIVDYGQNMDIYTSERGMLIPSYKSFFTGNPEDLGTALYNAILNLDIKDNNDGTAVIKDSTHSYSVTLTVDGGSLDLLRLSDKYLGTRLESEANSITSSVSALTSDITRAKTDAAVLDEDSELPKDFRDNETLNASFKAFTGEDIAGKSDTDISDAIQAAVAARMGALYSTVSVRDRFDILCKRMLDDTSWSFTHGEYVNVSSYRNFLRQFINVLSSVGLGTAQTESLSGLLKDAMTNSIYTGISDNNANLLYMLSNYYLLRREMGVDTDHNILTTDATEFSVINYFWDRYYLGQYSWVKDINSLAFEAAKLYSDSELSAAYSDFIGELMGENIGSPFFEAEDDGLKADFYESLGKDAVVILPYHLSDYETSSPGATCTSNTLRIYYTPYEDYARALYPDELSADDLTNTHLSVDSHDLLLALQKNTDTTHNTLALLSETASTSTATPTVSLDELKWGIWDIITDPLGYVSYLVTGIAYSVHSIFGTGDFSKVFDSSWLVNNSIYTWVADHWLQFYAIVFTLAILVAIIRHFAQKKLSSAVVVKTLGKAVLFAMLPIVTLNMAVATFNAECGLFIGSTANQIILSNTASKVQERINSDGAVKQELSVYMKQFDGISGSSSELQFAFPSGWDYNSNSPIYTDSKGEVKYTTLSQLLDQTIYANEKTWYTSDGFRDIHGSDYSDNVFYYFYDYLKGTYLNYARYHSNASSALSTLVRQFDTFDTSTSLTRKQDIATLEQEFAGTFGIFSEMMRDSAFIYGDSSTPAGLKLTGQTYFRDFMGLENIFSSDGGKSSAVTAKLQSSGWFQAFYNTEPYYVDMEPTGVVVATDTAHLGRDVYYSKLTPFISEGYTYKNAPEFTAFENTLAQFYSKLYSSVLEAIDFGSSRLSDEAAIEYTALIATLTLYDVFDLEPRAPDLSSVTMETYLRTIFLHDLTSVGENTNLLYEMLGQGDNIFTIILVVLEEILHVIVALLRNILILYLVVAATVISILHLFRDTEEYGTAMLGLGFNFIALVIIQLLSLILLRVPLFLASITTGSVVILAILVLSFVIFTAIGFLYAKLIKGLVMDAASFGGNFVKAGIRDMQAKFSSSNIQGGEINGNLEEGTFNINSAEEHTDETIAISDTKLEALNTAELESSVQAPRDILDSVVTQEEPPLSITPAELSQPANTTATVFNLTQNQAIDWDQQYNYIQLNIINQDAFSQDEPTNADTQPQESTDTVTSLTDQTIPALATVSDVQPHTNSTAAQEQADTSAPSDKIFVLPLAQETEEKDTATSQSDIEEVQYTESKDASVSSESAIQSAVTSAPVSLETVTAASAPISNSQAITPSFIPQNEDNSVQSDNSPSPSNTLKND